MSVDITVNWNFIRDGESTQVAYATLNAPAAQADHEAKSEESPVLDSVLPLGSSVLAPGLSQPIPAR